MAMSNLYYSAIGVLAIIIHLIINHNYYVQKDARKEVKEYKKYITAIFLYYLTDVAWGILNEIHNMPLLYADTILYHLAMLMSVVLCCKYIISFLKLKNIVAKMLDAFGFLFVLGGIVALVVNHFYHVLFWFDESGDYQTFSFRHIALASQILIFAFISVVSLVVALKKKDEERHRNMTICMFGFCMTMALLTQSFYPLIPLYTIGLMIGTLIIHVFIHNEEQQNQLTKIEELNNRLQEEQKVLQHQRDEIATSFGLINGLSRDYHTVWLVNKDDMNIRLVRSPNKDAILSAVQMGLNCANYRTVAGMYIDKYVVGDDKERVIQQTQADEVLRQLEKSDFYAVNYFRRNDEGKIEYSQIMYINADSANGKRQMVFGFRNIDEILKQEQALRKEINDAKEAAEAANAAKTSFLFNMSHDIRTPMNAIMGFRDLLEKNQEDPEKRANYLQKIEESSNVLLSIINNVLEMARIEKGVLEMDESAWSAEQFNDTLYSVFLDMMTQKGLEFTRKIDVQHHYAFCDPIKLREVFINILSNAYKYTKPGGKVHMLLEELPSDKEGYAVYRTTISDTGIGMAEEYLPHLFEEFTREHNSTHSKIEGTGLGMPIVKRLVDFMGGTIEVKSKKGEGTTFIVTLCHRIADKSQLAQAELETESDTFDGKRILLAEDNELNAEIADAVLSEIGFTVDIAVDGQDCVDKLSKADAGFYDLILMDIQMPRMNGYEATKAIRSLEDKEKAQVKIMAMTANAFEEDKREAMRVGMNGHLTKPINVHELTKALANAINQPE